jgi:hypothetical protein
MKMKHKTMGVLAAVLAAAGTASAADGITREAFHKDVLKSWHALDLDGDGYITQAELKSLPKDAQRMLAALQRADTDGDGRLSFKEVVAARMAAFDAADSNGDDVLSAAEVKAYEAKLKR